MGEPLTDLTFEEWIKFNFDRPVTDPQWYWDIDSDYWDGTPVITVDYLTRTFQNAAAIFQPYTNAQLKQGLWWLASDSQYMFAVLDEAVPWPDRRRCLGSMYQLFVQCLLPRCLPEHLSHLDVDVEEGSPLNTLCYMWWDLLPIYGHPAAAPGSSEAETDKVCMGVMARILRLGSDACRQSAIHGLGCWGGYYPEAVTGIVGEFLSTHQGLSPALREYAEWWAVRDER